MEDKIIVDLYWERSETAITETAKKYGKLCRSVAYNILRNTEDSEECVNDTYLGAWNSMPDQRPEKLPPFLSRITRSIAINKYDYNTAQKRGGGQPYLAIDELSEFLSDGNNTEEKLNEMFLTEIINKFLSSLSVKEHSIFLSRYWDMYSTAEISKIYGMNENTVKTTLRRTREKLKELLVKENMF